MIDLAIAPAVAVNRVNAGTRVPVPSVSDVIVHLFYIQDFLGIKQIVGVFWTLCLEVQCYLFFFWRDDVAVGEVEAVGTRLWMADVATICAVRPLLLGRGAVPSRAVQPRWFELFTGVVLFMYWRAQLNRTVLGVYLGVLLAALLISPQIHHIEAIVNLASLLLIALMFLVAVESGGMRTWLDAPPLRYFGTIFYSLYLMHAVVGIRLLKLLVHPRDTASHAWFMLAVGLLLSIAASDLMYRFIKRPSMNLSHRLKWRAAQSLRHPPSVSGIT